MIPESDCGLNQRTQDALCDLFRNDPIIAQVVLYGSRAKGNFKPGSDIDLAIDAPLFNLQKLLALQVGIDDLMLPYKVDVTVLHQIDNKELREHIQRIGKLFYQIS